MEKKMENTDVWLYRDYPPKLSQYYPYTPITPYMTPATPITPTKSYITPFHTSSPPSIQLSVEAFRAIVQGVMVVFLGGCRA